MRWIFGLCLMMAVLGCDSNVEPAVLSEDGSRNDAQDTDDGGRLQDAAVDTPDATLLLDMRCALAIPEDPEPSSYAPRPIEPAAGIDESEHVTWLEARRNLLASPEVHFIATYHHGLEAFIVASSVQAAGSEVTFRRGRGEGEPEFVVTGDLSAIFPRTEATVYGTAEELWDAFENPSEVMLADYGYASPDPRVGYLPFEAHFFPRPLERLATLFESVDAPDLVYGVLPHAASGIGTHGGLSGLQSRATLIMSGPGVRQGAILEDAAALVDIAPTALAALGAETVSGQGSSHLYDDGLFLLKQDGRVLTEALNPLACDRPEHVVIIIFDGLQALEINRQVLTQSPEVVLPNFRRLTEAGVLYRYGALSGYPSFSAPGHTTVGTGVWPGHHGVLGNAYYSRTEQGILTPFDLITNLVNFVAEPERALDLYRRLFTGEPENLAQASHRAFGPWSPEDDSGAFVAVINELTFLDADFSTLSFLSGSAQTKALPEYRVADGLAITQVNALMYDSDYPVPTVLQMSLFSPDAAGESDGPHSPLLRETLLEVDYRLGLVLEAYTERGVFDKTLFILTADHGMELQDPTRRAAPQLGVRTSFNSAGLVYLRTLEVDVAGGEDDSQLVVTVRNHDNDAPIIGAEVRCDSCLDGGGATDPAGRVVIEVIDVESPVELQILHPEYNSQHLRLQSLGDP